VALVTTQRISGDDWSFMGAAMCERETLSLYSWLVI